MKALKQVGLATAMALVMACGLASAASATTIDPVNTAFTLTSTNTTFAFHGTNISFSCGHSVITGTTGFTSATWVSLAATPTYDDCLWGALVPVTVTPSAACQTPATRPAFDIMGVSGVTAAVKMTLPITCNIDIFVSVVNCTWTITGGTTIGNGTTGTGGGDWTNRGTASTLHFDTAVIPTILNVTGGVPSCLSQGVHTGTLTGDYAVASATNLIVTP